MALYADPLIFLCLLMCAHWTLSDILRIWLRSLECCRCPAAEGSRGLPPYTRFVHCCASVSRLQEITIGAGPLIPLGAPNTPMLGYIDWLSAVEQKLLDHVAENVEHYPIVEKSLVCEGDGGAAFLFPPLAAISQSPWLALEVSHGPRLADMISCRTKIQ